jgi:hypothetical protein
LLNNLWSKAATWRYHCVGCSTGYNCIYLIVMDHMYFDTDGRTDDPHHFSFVDRTS